jgi:hypothetical protein
MRWIFPIALLLALLTPAYADDWWRDQPAPCKRIRRSK